MQLLSIERLHSLQAELELFRKEETLNKFQSWVMKNLYKFELAADFAAKSVIIVAIPHPPYAEVEFIWKGDQYRFKSLVMSDSENTKRYLTSLVAEGGYRLKHAPDLPLKRLAVHSGLAVYGKNNICLSMDWAVIFPLTPTFRTCHVRTNGWKYSTLRNVLSAVFVQTHAPQERLALSGS